MISNALVDQAIQELQTGKPVLIYDADGREEETDMVYASEFVTPAVIQTLRKDCGGLICTTVHNTAWERLGLPYLSEIFHKMGGEFSVLHELIPNDIPYDEISAFTVTINHRKTFTGITDNDRALTVSEFAKLLQEIRDMPNGNAMKVFGQRFRAPGHIHLLNASANLLEKRFGHTELSTALMVMAELTPSATICEMMGDDGNALDKDAARAYAEEQGLVFMEGKEVIDAWREYQ